MFVLKLSGYVYPKAMSRKNNWGRSYHLLIIDLQVQGVKMRQVMLTAIIGQFTACIFELKLN